MISKWDRSDIGVENSHRWLALVEICVVAEWPGQWSPRVTSRNARSDEGHNLDPGRPDYGASAATVSL